MITRTKKTGRKSNLPKILYSYHLYLVGEDLFITKNKLLPSLSYRIYIETNIIKHNKLQNFTKNNLIFIHIYNKQTNELNIMKKK